MSRVSATRLSRPASVRIGVISDTHGLLRPEVQTALNGVVHILHAGDVGDSLVLDRLRTIAPVSAVRGNVDTSGVLAELPPTDCVELAGLLFYLVHRLEDLDLKPAAAGVRAVITGHTHKAALRWQDDVLYLNPGSVGPKRFRLPVSLAFLTVRAGKIEPELVTLD